jgi:opacity protein-like surface antigen
VGFASLARFVTLPSVLLSYLCITNVAVSAEFGDVELSVYALGSWPRDQDIFNQGTTVPASIQEGFGAGLKVGLFPSKLRRMVGLEIDSNIHGSALSFPNTADGRNNETGSSDLLVYNSTFNLVLRYPGEQIRPYVGVGIGWSNGTLLNPNIAGRDDKDFDSARAFTYQFLGGAQLVLSPHVPLFNSQQTVAIFLFGEYRYLSSDYHWEGLAMDLRTHYGLLGVGLRF